MSAPGDEAVQAGAAKWPLRGTFSKDELGGGIGSRVSAVVTETKYPGISDRAALDAYVKEHDAFDLFQARINKEAWKAREGDVTGVSVYTKIEIKLKPTKR